MAENDGRSELEHIVNLKSTRAAQGRSKFESTVLQLVQTKSWAQIAPVDGEEVGNFFHMGNTK